MGFTFEKPDVDTPVGVYDIRVCCSWNPAATGRVPFDIDCHAFGLMYREGSVASAMLYRTRFGTFPNALTYGNADMIRDPAADPHAFRTPDGSMIHYGDCRHGMSEGHDEEMLLRLHLLPDRVDEIAVWITLNAAPRRRETFAHVSSADVRVKNDITHKELCYFPLKEKYPGARALHVCSFVREDSDWKFIPVGVGVDADVQMICMSYMKDEETHLPAFAGSDDVSTRTMVQFACSSQDTNSAQLSTITMEEFAASVDPLAPEELLRNALSIASSLSPQDPESRFAIFGSDLQQEYSVLLRKALRLGKDKRFKRAKTAQAEMLELISSIDFETLVQPQAYSWWHFFSNFFSTAPSPYAEAQRQFTQTERKVRTKKEQLDRHLSSLQNLRNQVEGLEVERQQLLHRMRAYLIAGSYFVPRLEESKKANLESRIQSLTISVQTGGNELQSQLQLTIIDGLMHAIRDTNLTWLPVWLSTAKEVFTLLQHEDIVAESSAYLRAVDARNNILTLGPSGQTQSTRKNSDAI